MRWVINDLLVFYRDLKRILLLNKPSCGITNWRQFESKVKKKNKDLLQKLPYFPNAILVTGCQRSGTTIMASIFTQSKNMVNYSSGFDDELDAALILSGLEPCLYPGRYCFQTTYLNDRYLDYIDIPESVKIVWVLRNPFDVINSMLNNWSSLALWELYTQCKNMTKQTEISPFLFPFKRLDIACLAYYGKLSQLLELASIISADKLLIVNYEDLVENGDFILPDIFVFANLEYTPSHALKFQKTSQLPLNKEAKSKIEAFCGTIYEEARKLSLTMGDRKKGE